MVISLNNWETLSQRPMNTVLPVAHPVPKYWQQRCDYDIKCELDEKNLKLNGSETVTYFNNSPDVLTYLWLQLDENQHSTVNNANYQSSNTMTQQVNPQQIGQSSGTKTDNGYGFNIIKITDAAGKPLNIRSIKP